MNTEAYRDADTFRRDQDLARVVPADLIAEFRSLDDAQAFLAFKGAGFTLTAGLNHVYGVRRLILLSRQAI